MTEFASIHDSFAHAVDRWPDRPFMEVLPRTADVYKIAAEEITFEDAMDEVDHWAERLEDAGYTAGMRIALLLENRPVYFLLLLAANRLGLSIVPINPDLRAAELEYMIGHAEPALIIAIPSRVDDLRTVLRAARIDAKAITLLDPVPRPRRTAVTAALTDVPAQREAAMLYTSGTTGNPKGFVLSNTYFTQLGPELYQHGWHRQTAEQGRADDHAPSLVSHERHVLFLYGNASGGRMFDCGGSLSSLYVVGVMCATAMQPACITLASCLPS